MVSLPQYEDTPDGQDHDHDHDHGGDSGGCGTGGGCGTSCGSGLEKIYPTTAVRYGRMNWIGEFSYKPNTVFKCGAKVVISTERGMEIGEQVSLTCNGCDKSVSREQIATYVKNSGREYYRLRSGRILREATSTDVLDHAKLNESVKEECDHAALLAAQMNLDMKIVTTEHLLGGERVVYYFMSDGRVDFRELVRELAARHQTRIEMRQVGPRDEARLVADHEICGRECCCKNFLKTLRPVTMKMAKVQKATLDLSKVSGRCGRLRCCLRYEHEGYEELASKLPNRGVRVRSEAGTGVVIDKQILTQLIMIRCDDGKVITVPLEEIQEFNVPAAPVQPASPEARGDGNGNGKAARPARERERGRDRGRGRPRRDRPERGGAPGELQESGSEPQAPASEPAADEPQAAGGDDGAGESRESGEGDSTQQDGGGRPGRHRRRGRRRRRSGGSESGGGPAPAPES